MNEIMISPRIKRLKEKMLSDKRYASIEQALIITETYKQNENKSVIIKRALALKNSLLKLEIDVENEELIVGNRTKGVRDGVVFPESGSSWIDREIEDLPTRAQDKFNVKFEDIEKFRKIIKPYWEEHSLEDVIREGYGKEIDEIAKVVKINQKDHAQGHICPNCREWLALGPEGIKQKALKKMKDASKENKDFYESVVIVMEGTQEFMMRYHNLMKERANTVADGVSKSNMLAVAENCKNLSKRPAKSFHEAVQSIWFLFVILHMESNASSFSPGRMDEFLYPYYKKDIEDGILNNEKALEIIECIWLKFNQIVYLRNSHSAKFFAGFPIGFNIAIGGQDEKRNDFSNELSFLFLKAQEHLGLPQPNLSVRLHKETSEELLKESIKVVA
ncbi:MAG TPA: pyruvate formate lyase family protein, partial [Clostridium sp.]